MTDLGDVYREEWPRCVAILTRVLGDLERAEDAVQDAFALALERWPREGVPRTPGAWIVTTARNRAIDRIRREQTFARKAELLARLEELPGEEDELTTIPDDRLALVFTCCHPALALDAQVALTLREVGGLVTPRSPGPSWCRRRRWLSAWSGRSAGSARPASRSACHPTISCPSGCRASSRVDLSRLQRGLRGERRSDHVRGELCAEAIRLAKLLLRR